jgi:hypothetical protein
MADSGRLDDGQILAGGFVFPVMQAAQFSLIGTADVRAVTSYWVSRPVFCAFLWRKDDGLVIVSRAVPKNCP